jgi:hypothetical protein
MATNDELPNELLKSYEKPEDLLGERRQDTFLVCPRHDGPGNPVTSQGTIRSPGFARPEFRE